jgi:hypothetical protein
LMVSGGSSRGAKIRTFGLDMEAPWGEQPWNGSASLGERGGKRMGETRRTAHCRAMARRPAHSAAIASACMSAAARKRLGAAPDAASAAGGANVLIRPKTAGAKA